MDKKRILIVDDEQELCEIISEELISYGYQTVCAFTKQQALETAKSMKLDGVLSDFNLDGESGLKLIEELKKVQSLKVAILMTGYQGLSLRDLNNIGVDLLLEKPFDFKALFKTLDRKISPRGSSWSPSRNYDRFSIDLPIKLSSNDQKTYQGSIQNISLGGALIKIDPAPQKGETFNFEINSASTKYMSLRGSLECRWSDEKEICGTQFHELSPEIYDTLLLLINDIKSHNLEL